MIVRLSLLAALLLMASMAVAQIGSLPASRDDTLAALAQARQQGEAARRRSEALEAEAAKATDAADKTARESAALAARIQQSEAEIAARQAQIGLIERQRLDLRTRLAERQRPVVRLTAALQRLSRRPPVLSLLRPGSVVDTMHLRALLQTMLPQITQRTAALRADLARGQALQRQAIVSTRSLRTSQADLAAQRTVLAGIETRQRLVSRQATGVADRETERALALSEQARDLSGLVDQMAKVGALRDRLAALPGPSLRPLHPGLSQVAETAAPSTGAARLTAYALPVDGRLIAGFGSTLGASQGAGSQGGDAQGGATQSRGIAIAARPGAQVVAPAAGRVAFAGPYRGYGNIVIIEHVGGWTSLITGLAQCEVRVGDVLVGGAPLGTAGPGDAPISLELRRQGVPVNPLEFLSQ